MRPRFAEVVWLLSAWSVVVAGPAAALEFIRGCVPSIHCEPKRECLHESIDHATGVFVVSTCLLILGTTALWLTRALASRSASHSAALLKAALLCLLLCAVVVCVLGAGMRAVVDGRTDVAARLVATGLLAIPTSVQLWRTLVLAGTRNTATERTLKNSPDAA